MTVFFINKKSVIKTLVFVVLATIVLYFAGGTLNRAISVFSHTRKIPIYSVETNEKKIALSFDCAWGADDIPQILSILKKHGVKATFFVVGRWAVKYPEAIKAMSEDGHDVANHSYSHLRMGPLTGQKSIEEISKCSDVIFNLTGKKTNLFRAPYGDYTDALINAAESLKYYTIQWDVDSLDWKKEMSAQAITLRVVNSIRNGSIVLFHNDTTHTVAVLEQIITAIKVKGYDIIPVSQLIYKDLYHIDHTGRQYKKR